MDSYVKTKNGREAIKAYNIEEVSEHLPILTFKPLQRNHKIINYSTDFITLDTETSHDSLERGWIYQWACKLKKIYVYGRKPDELINFLEMLAERYQLRADKRILIYIHNSAYDLQYLKAFLFKYDPTAHFFSIDAHSIIICDVLGFRILCSYKLTNMSLDALSKNYAETYAKAVGEINYTLIRYQDSELTPEDWFYMFSDVAAQYDGIKGYLKMQGYKYAFKAPFTSTGFVRAKCRKASKLDTEWRSEFLRSKMSLEMYNLERQCFMGGVCIASFMYSGQTVRSERLRHKDFCSSYPARQLINYFPCGAPSWYGEVNSVDELEYVLSEYCCIFLLTLDNVHIKKGVTAPCIPSSKCIHIEDAVKVNGKVVHATTLTMAVCELDYKWIKRQYTADNISVDKMLIYERGSMPDWLKSEVYEYFKNKCELKNATDENGQMLYAKSKSFLNSIYGMTATSLIRDTYKMSDEHILVKEPYDKDKAAGDLSKYYKSFNSFMRYDAAIYTTAWARDALYTMIECAGYDNFLYCDTDSVFYLETPENKIRMEEYADYCKDEAIKHNAYVGSKYLGLPEDEPPIRAFRALHSKCYAMEELNKKTGKYELNVVIAGIPKKSIKWIEGKPVLKTNAEELGSIDNLKDGFIFSHCGGTRCVYNERPITIEEINGHKTLYSSSAVIDNIDKEISDTMWTTTDKFEVVNVHEISI